MTSNDEQILHDFAYLRSMTVEELRRIADKRHRVEQLQSALQDSLDYVESLGAGSRPTKLECVLFEVSPEAWRAHIEEYLIEEGCQTSPNWLTRHSLWHVGLIIDDDSFSSTMVNVSQHLPGLAVEVALWMQDELSGLLGVALPFCVDHADAPPLTPIIIARDLGWQCRVDDSIQHVSPLHER